MTGSAQPRADRRSPAEAVTTRTYRDGGRGRGPRAAVDGTRTRPDRPQVFGVLPMEARRRSLRSVLPAACGVLGADRRAPRVHALEPSGVGVESCRRLRAVDTATHPDHRGIGIFSMLTDQALHELRGQAELVFNTPNGRSLPGYLKMGWRTVGRIPVAVRVRRPITVARGYRRIGSTAAANAAGTCCRGRAGRRSTGRSGAPPAPLRDHRPLRGAAPHAVRRRFPRLAVRVGSTPRLQGGARAGVGDACRHRPVPRAPARPALGIERRRDLRPARRPTHGATPSPPCRDRRFRRSRRLRVSPGVRGGAGGATPRLRPSAGWSRAGDSRHAR